MHKPDSWVLLQWNEQARSKQFDNRDWFGALGLTKHELGQASKSYETCLKLLKLGCFKTKAAMNSLNVSLKLFCFDMSRPYLKNNAGHCRMYHHRSAIERYPTQPTSPIGICRFDMLWYGFYTILYSGSCSFSCYGHRHGNPHIMGLTCPIPQGLMGKPARSASDRIFWQKGSAGTPLISHLPNEIRQNSMILNNIKRLIIICLCKTYFSKIIVSL